RMLPVLETGELASYAPASRNRIHRWRKLAPRIGDDVFIKLFAHGAQENNAAALLGGYLDSTLADLSRACELGGQSLFFVSAWQMRCAVDAVRSGGGARGPRCFWWRPPPRRLCTDRP